MFIWPIQVTDPAAQNFKDLGPNKYVWVASPNFNERPKDAPIDTIVLHHTAGPTLRGCVLWFADTKSQVSAHYTVGKDGTIVQHVSLFKRAWHAGKSQDKFGREGVNDFSIGIEMVNVGDGKDPWTPEQVNAVDNLLRYLTRHAFPEIKQITTHEFIAQPLGRKNDPKAFPWDGLKGLKTPIYRDTADRPDQNKK